VSSFLNKYKNILIIFLTLLSGFLIRIFFADKFITVSGDLRLYAEWGEKFWILGGKDFYFNDDWFYASPNYPPLINIVYAASYWIYDKRYYLAQIHNAVKIIPSSFIVFFSSKNPQDPLQYGYGYYLLLKLPGILADLGLSVLIYRVVLKITKSLAKSYLAMCFYLFNPVAIILSAIWGQTDSVVSLFALLSFLILLEGKIALSIPLYFLSLYIKPNWIYLGPFYLFILAIKRPKLKQVLLGVLILLMFFVISTVPFSGKYPVGFFVWLAKNRLLATVGVAEKLSVSAFNLYTVFGIIDFTLNSVSILGLKIKYLGWLIFAGINYLTINHLRRKKVGTQDVMYGIFAIAFSSYLFLTNMLERYFFAGFVPLIILTFTDIRIFIYSLTINLSVLMNLLYSFFRRKYGVVADVFTANNYLFIRGFSFVNVFSWVMIMKNSIIINIAKK
jgi:Gpi18-like mannosyltransferase